MMNTSKHLSPSVIHNTNTVYKTYNNVGISVWGGGGCSKTDFHAEGSASP
jgi:hypothetical protein